MVKERPDSRGKLMLTLNEWHSATRPTVIHQQLCSSSQQWAPITAALTNIINQRVSGRAVAVAGGILLSVLVGRWWVYTMAICGGNPGLEFKSSALPRAGQGTVWGAHPRRRAARRGKDETLLPSFLPFGLCLTALWPPSWFPAGPGVTWFLWAPGQRPLRDVVGSDREQREKKLQTPDCREWLVW